MGNLGVVIDETFNKRNLMFNQEYRDVIEWENYKRAQISEQIERSKW
jgi:hypothetical protein